MERRDIDDWSFYDHLVFLRRSLAVVIGLAACLGLAGYGIAKLRGARYVSEGIMRIGTIYRRGLVEAPRDVAVRIASASFLATTAGDRPAEFPEGAAGLTLEAWSAEESEIVRIVATAESPDEAKALVSSAVARIVAEHEVPQSHGRKIIEDSLEAIRQESAQLKNILDAPSSAAATDALVETALRGRGAIERLTELRKAELELRLMADPAVASNTRLLEGPSLRRKSEAAKSLVLGAVSGVALALLFIYARAYVVQGLRKRQSGSSAAQVPAPAPR